MSKNDCICKGNWRLIIREFKHLIDHTFTDSKGDQFIFFGVVFGSDDYYYGMSRISGNGDKFQLLSCVGSIETHGYRLKK